MSNVAHGPVKPVQGSIVILIYVLYQHVQLAPSQFRGRFHWYVIYMSDIWLLMFIIHSIGRGRSKFLNLCPIPIALCCEIKNTLQTKRNVIIRQGRWLFVSLLTAFQASGMYNYVLILCMIIQKFVVYLLVKWFWHHTFSFIQYSIYIYIYILYINQCRQVVIMFYDSLYKVYNSQNSHVHVYTCINDQAVHVLYV